jgi:hypothetical protein
MGIKIISPNIPVNGIAIIPTTVEIIFIIITINMDFKYLSLVKNFRKINSITKPIIIIHHVIIPSKIYKDGQIIFAYAGNVFKNIIKIKIKNVFFIK